MAWPSKATQITAWSFSRWSTYQKCPLRAKFLYIDKMKEPQSAPMMRGDEIHKEAEAYLKGVKTRVPKTVETFADEFKTVKALYKKDPDAVTVESTWAFRRDWSLTRWDDWNGCWLRVKVDHSYLVPKSNTPKVVVTDVKSGKFSNWNLEDYKLQLELYGLAALLVHQDKPELEVNTRLMYVDVGIYYPPPEEPMTFTPRDLPGLKKTWEKRTKAMLNDAKFAPRPGDHCRWCSFSKEKGGSCKF